MARCAWAGGPGGRRPITELDRLSLCPAVNQFHNPNFLGGPSLVHFRSIAARTRQRRSSAPSARLFSAAELPRAAAVRPNDGGHGARAASPCTAELFLIIGALRFCSVTTCG